MEEGNDCGTALESTSEAQTPLQSSHAVYGTCLACTYLTVFATSSSVSQVPQITLRTLPYHGCVLLHPQEVDSQKGNFFPRNLNPRISVSVVQSS